MLRAWLGASITTGQQTLDMPGRKKTPFSSYIRLSSKGWKTELQSDSKRWVMGQAGTPEGEIGFKAVASGTHSHVYGSFISCYAL